MATAQSLVGHMDERPFFNVERMHAPSSKYVCWVDVMGSDSAMRRSIKIAANFVMKLHVAALEVLPTDDTVVLYPVIDGLYACAAGQGRILDFLKGVLFRVALSFVSEREPIQI